MDMQSREDLLFVAKVAVGKKDDMAQVARRFWLLHNVKQRRKYFRAAASLKILDEPTRSGEILRGSGQGRGGKFTISVVERQDAEVVAGAETVEGLQQRFASLRDGSATHGTGDINHVEHFDGDPLDGLHGRRKSREQEVGFAGSGIGREEESGLGLCAFGLLDFKDKIFVWNGGTRGKLHVPAAVRQTTNSNGVRNRVDRTEFESGV